MIVAFASPGSCTDTSRPNASRFVHVHLSGPSVGGDRFEPLFQSAVGVWQSGVMAVVLTGMGADGMRGGKDIVAAGGNVIAQDEATSVVWGMPGAAAQAGICAAILPLGQIGPKLVRVFSGDRS